MQNIMLNSKTIGGGPQAPIAEIGAVEFNIQTGEIGDRFHTKIKTKSTTENLSHIDVATTIWWLQQSYGTRVKFTNRDEHTLASLQEFVKWMNGRCKHRNLRVLGNEAIFDGMILTSTRQGNVQHPSPQYSKDFCYRAIRALAPNIEIEQIESHHSTVDIAEKQARHLIEIWEAI